MTGTPKKTCSSNQQKIGRSSNSERLIKRLKLFDSFHVSEMMALECFSGFLVSSHPGFSEFFCVYTHLNAAEIQRRSCILLIISSLTLKMNAHASFNAQETGRFAITQRHDDKQGRSTVKPGAQVHSPVTLWQSAPFWHWHTSLHDSP